MELPRVARPRRRDAFSGIYDHRKISYLDKLAKDEFQHFIPANFKNEIAEEHIKVDEDEED